MGGKIRILYIFSLVTGEPNGQLGAVLAKIKEVDTKNGPFSAAFIMGGAPTIEDDLSALFDVIKTDYLSERKFV